LVFADLTKNKETLNNLIEDFHTTRSVSTAEQIKHVLQIISIDLSLLESEEESSSVDLTLKSLSSSLFRIRLLKENKEFSKAYNKLLLKLKNQEENLNSLSKENSLMMVKIEEDKSDLLSCQLSLKNAKSLKKITEDLLESEQENRSDQIETIENSLTEAEKLSRASQMQNFQGVQDSQNELIKSLQKQNSQLALKLEQAQTDFSALSNSMNLDKSSCDSVRNELKARSEQLLTCESHFEEFRRKVELENIDQVQVLKDSQIQLQKEIQDLQDDRQKALKNFNDCSKQLAEVEIQEKIKENLMKGLKGDLEHAENSIESAKNARSQEIEILQQSNLSVKNTMAGLQKQYDEALEKILNQGAVINELQAKIEDFEYISKRNLRG
jgi:chromosome segregation ATPase